MKYPEHEKLLKAKEESQSQGEFLEWVMTKYTLAVWEGTTLYPAYVNIKKLLAEFHNIDLDKLEGEVTQLLEELRK